ncbi:MAG TPA: Stp1/IreP family PP2C-type Ser/Thr phosphatase [Solirubrobacteraceae bacterium]|nr:Stp1/IreP family PP2C-type Ser/Thr phosphatase [Solirubrobacteraceae bacterium]
MLRVAEQYAATDTGRQRRANEDSHLARAPLFVVADGMGGAQAGEVASRLAVESFQGGLQDAAEPEHALAELTRAANARIHELSHSHAEQAGMGTTLTAVYVGEREISIAHVGDSRAYRLREGELLRLTDDHSLVDELLRQGRLTPEEALEHPQRSVITRALGPEGMVEVDTRSYTGRDADVYLLCSDGLTTMVPEYRLAELLREHDASLRDAGEALILAANEAGGRDNITVVLLRLEELDAAATPMTEEASVVAASPTGVPEAGPGEDGAASPSPAWSGQGAEAPPAAVSTAGASATATAPVVQRRPRSPSPEGKGRRRGRRRLRRTGAVAIVLVVLAVIGAGAYVALQSVYFIGTNDRGLVTVYRGVPYRLPGSLALYSSDYVSGVGASTLTPHRRDTLLDHSLRSEANAAELVRSLELGQLE